MELQNNVLRKLRGSEANGRIRKTADLRYERFCNLHNSKYPWVTIISVRMM